MPRAPWYGTALYIEFGCVASAMSRCRGSEISKPGSATRSKRTMVACTAQREYGYCTPYDGHLMPRLFHRIGRRATRGGEVRERDKRQGFARCGLLQDLALSRKEATDKRNGYSARRRAHTMHRCTRARSPEIGLMSAGPISYLYPVLDTESECRGAGRGRGAGGRRGRRGRPGAFAGRGRRGRGSGRGRRGWGGGGGAGG